MATSSNSSVYINVVGAITVDSPLSIAANEISLPLTSAHILVGNGGGVAADVAVTGDVTISNAGVTAIGALKVTGAMIAAQTIAAKTDDYTLVLTDALKLLTLSNAGAKTLTIPTNASVAFPIGSIVDAIQIGAGQFTVAGAGGVTVHGVPGLKISAQWGKIRLQKIASDTWNVNGDLSA